MQVHMPLTVYSIRMTSEQLGISRTEVYRLISKGLIEEVYVADKRMLTKESVDKYITLRDQIRRIEKEMKNKK